MIGGGWGGLQAFLAGQARSIGVSNYNVSELQEIVAAGMPLPAINQIPINVYRSTSQKVRVSGRVHACVWARPCKRTD